MEKNIARKLIFQRRKELSAEGFQKKSGLIESRLWNYLKANFQEPTEFYLYCSYNNEVNTWGMIETCFQNNFAVAVPKSDAKTCEMQFYYIQSLQDLTDGYMGISEPMETCQKAFPIEKNRLLSENSDILARDRQRILIMPGVAFDEQRNRAGYGKGFYDRYVTKYKFDKVIALAFEFQIVDELICDKKDKKPDCIITEQRIIGS